MAASRELELKLEGDAAGAAAVKRHPMLAGIAPQTVQQSTTYFDTPDQALRKAGLSLRVRSAGGGFVQTVKDAGSGGAGLFDRGEWEWPVALAEPDLAKLRGTPARKAINGQPVEPTVAANACRSLWMLQRPDSSIELVLDEGKVAGNGAEQAFAEVEIELKAGSEAALFDVGRELVDAAGLSIGVMTKAERGRRIADGSATKAAKAERIWLSDELSAAEGFSAIAYSCLRHFRLNEPLLVEHRHPEALHQARVAMRRLRSAFSLFRPVIADARYEVLREEVSWFTSQLGDARNIDVMLKRFPKGEKQSDLQSALLEERKSTYATMLAAVRSRRLKLLLFDIVEWIETGEWRASKAAAKPLRGFARRALGKRWRRLKAQAALFAEMDAEARHRLRIEVKKLRYAAEFLASIEWSHTSAVDEKRFVRELETMQEQLGELNDRETGRQIFAGLLGRRRDARKLMAEAEQLLGGEAAEDKPLLMAQGAALRLIATGPYWRR